MSTLTPRGVRMLAFVETSAKYETGQLGSGTYLITNVRAQIHAVPARDKSVVGDVRPDKDHETGLLRNMLWRVNALENGKFAIQAVTGDTVLYAICDVDPEFGDEITTSTTGQQWIIKETDRKGHYVIQHTICPELIWGLRRDDVLTKITLREVYSEPRHQWQFQSVEVPPPPFCESDIVEDDKTSYSRFNDAEDVIKSGARISGILRITVHRAPHQYMISGSYVAALHVTYLLSDGSTRQFRHGRPATVTSTQTIDFDESEVLIGIDGCVMDDQILYCTFEVQDIRSKIEETLLLRI